MNPILQNVNFLLEHKQHGNVVLGFQLLSGLMYDNALKYGAKTVFLEWLRICNPTKTMIIYENIKQHYTGYKKDVQFICKLGNCYFRLPYWGGSAKEMTKTLFYLCLEQMVVDDFNRRLSLQDHDNPLF